VDDSHHNRGHSGIGSSASERGALIAGKEVGLGADGPCSALISTAAFMLTRAF
jgi:hypothetical protein